MKGNRLAKWASRNGWADLAIDTKVGYYKYKYGLKMRLAPKLTPIYLILGVLTNTTPEYRILA